MRKFVVFACILVCLLMAGCGNSLENAQVTRDSLLTGGDISFEYNKEARLITISGEVEYYEADILKGWEKAGNRIGLTFNAPSGIDEYETGSLSYLDKSVGGGDFFAQVNSSRVGRFTIYPLIEEGMREFEIKVTWQEGIEEQIYKVKLEDVELKKGA